MNEEYDVFLKICIKKCSFTEQCAGDIKKFLIKKKLKPVDIDRIIDYLVENNFINHNRYAKAFVNDKLKFNKWGKNKIRYMLKTKGIENNVVEKSISEIDIDQYKSILKNIIDKKSASLKYTDKYELNNKIIKYCLAKGFEYNEIIEFVK